MYSILRSGYDSPPNARFRGNAQCPPAGRENRLLTLAARGLEYAPRVSLLGIAVESQQSGVVIRLSG
jgi:hypothetical protein